MISCGNSLTRGVLVGLCRRGWSSVDDTWICLMGRMSR